MKLFACEKCGSLDVYTKKNGSATGLYCGDCGKWIKWLNKEDKILFEKQKEENQFLKEVALQSRERTQLEKLEEYKEQKKFELCVENNAYNRGYIKGLEIAIKIMEGRIK